ncbi:MAG: AAA family ATPase, partial [Chloroflexi bacterium]|nr:AAA family ATPase [Chloroflexota bacterium]
MAEGRHLTLVSAPAGFGKTTLLRDWAAGCERLVAWLALDAGDGDPQRFLTYVAAALQQVAPGLGAGTRRRAPGLLRASSAPPAESALTALLNDLAALSTDVVLVLDDYHVLDAPAIHAAVGFLVEHLPAQAHLVIATR